MSYKYMSCHKNICYIIQIYTMSFKYMLCHTSTKTYIICHTNVYYVIAIYILFHANTYYIIQLYIMSFNIKEQLYLSITEATYIIVG
jgi:hypothetical protein